MRNAVYDDAILCGLAHARAAQLPEFRGDAIFFSEFVHAHDKRRRKAVFAPAEKANFLHLLAPVRNLGNCFSCTRLNSPRAPRKGAAPSRPRASPPPDDAPPLLSRPSLDKPTVADRRWCLHSGWCGRIRRRSEERRVGKECRSRW